MNTYARVENDLRSTWTFVDVARLAGLFWRHGLLLVSAAIIGMSVMLVSMIISGPSYEVSAKLLVRLDREMMAPALVDARDAGQLQQLSRRPEDLASEVEIFTDPRLLQRTVDSFGADFFLAEDPPRTLYQHVKYAAKALRRWFNDVSRKTLVLVGLRQQTTPLDRITLAIAQGLTVEAVRKSDVVEITMRFPDPKVGELFLNRFVTLGMQSHVDAYKSKGERAFLEGEREKLATELQEAEERLLEARSNQDAIYSGADRFATLLKAEADTQQQLDAAKADLADTQAQVNYAAEALKTIPSDVTLSTVQSRRRGGDDAVAQLNQLNVELAKLRTTYSDEAPEIKEVLKQIAALTAVREQQSGFRVDGTTTGPNPQYTQMARDLAAKEGLRRGQVARVAALTAQIGRLGEQALSAQRLEIEIAQVERRVAQLRRSIETYDKALEEARLAETMDTLALSNLTVIMPPTGEVVPSSPSILRSLVMGLAGALTLAIGFILVRDWRRRTMIEDMV